MRDVFGILAIGLAVLALGVFRVPDENALVAAGIAAAAERAVYQEPHPISVTVEGRLLTAQGRVETEAQRRDLISRLEALDGVEEVVDGLTLLPTVQPFALRIAKGADEVQFEGHVSSRAQAEALGQVLSVPAPALAVATGMPDADWGGVAVLAARQLGRMLDGELRLSDHDLLLSGRVHLPVDLNAITEALADLPEPYRLRQRIEVVDDGLPYRVHVVRDPFLGLRLAGKLPPDMDPAVFDVLGSAQERALASAPLPLDMPGFAEALLLALPLAAELERGTLSVSPGVVALDGGPVSDAYMKRAEGLRAALPDGYALHLGLIPEDDGAGWHVALDWDGAALSVAGYVPLDFDAEALVAEIGAPLGTVVLERGPYRDLAGWASPLIPAVRGLRLLQRGQLRLEVGAEAVQITGVAANPLVRRRAAEVSGLDTEAVLLADDGAPAVFDLRYDAATGAAVAGKLPAGLSVRMLADALGLDRVRGQVRVAPDGDGATVLAALSALQPWLAEVEGFALSYDRGAVALAVEPVPVVEADALRAVLSPVVPRGVALDVPEAERPLAGTRRTHASLGIAQVFSDGAWLPVLEFTPSPETCAAALATLPQVPFDPGRFVPVLGSSQPLARLASVARGCMRFAGLDLVIGAQAEVAGNAVLGRQLARRRAESVRAALVARGVEAGAVTASGFVAAAPERLEFRWR